MNRDEGPGLAVSYALPVVPSQFLFVITMVYFVKFGTDVLLVSPGKLALIFGLSRLWDAVSDPMAGFLSDRTRLAFGRRRSWIAGSGLPIALSAVMVWSPPAGLEGSSLILWLSVAMFAFSSAFTAFEVPHNALAAEVSERPDIRARLFGARAWAMVIGTYAALTVGIRVIRTAGDPRAAATGLAVVGGLLFIAAAVVCVGRLREPPEHANLGGASPFGAFRDLLGNPHARLVLLVVFCEYLGTGGAAVLIAYLYDYVLHAAHLTELAFVVMGVAQLLGVPLWVRMMRRLDKARVWQLAMTVAATGCLLQFAVGLQGSAVPFVIVSFLYAFGASATVAVGPVLMADVVDSDELATGERKEGVYFAGWHFTRKSMQGLMLVVAGVALEVSGFVPNALQSETTRWTILLLATLAPAIGYAAGALLLTRFGLRGDALADQQRRLRERRAQVS